MTILGLIALAHGAEAADGAVADQQWWAWAIYFIGGLSVLGGLLRRMQKGE